MNEAICLVIRAPPPSHSLSLLFKMIIKIVSIIGNEIDDNLKEFHENFEGLSSDEEILINDIRLSTISESSKIEITSSSSFSMNIPRKSEIIDEDNDSILSQFASPIELDESIDDNQTIEENNISIENSNEFFYDFKAENFHAEQVRSFLHNYF